MYSIGVDIGTSTTAVIISKIDIITKTGPSLLPLTQIEKTEIVYAGPIYFTPLINHDTIDFDGIKQIVGVCISESGIAKEQIETGAVIITGETARKENAARVSTSLSEYLGDFVVATAGPKLESILAGRGSGICDESKKRNKMIMNLDIGGGTLNASVFDCGNSVASFAMDIGGRLIRFDSDLRITYSSDRIEPILTRYGLLPKVGSITDWTQLEHICELLADACLQGCNLKVLTPQTEKLFLTEMPFFRTPDFISISGGVGEYVTDCSRNAVRSKSLEYGDIGPILGKKIYDAFRPYGSKLIVPKETIRATVIGAGNHTLALSGSTVGVDANILPIRNIPIVKSQTLPEEWHRLYEQTKPLLPLYTEEVLALGIHGKPSPKYEELKLLASQIACLFDHTDSPVIILLKEDFAKALAQVLRIHANCSKPIVCLDHIDWAQGDYIDIGRPVGSAIPVVIKTLIYRS